MEVLIYVFDVTSKVFNTHDMQQFELCLEALTELSAKTRIFCLIHKMDLLTEAIRNETFMQKKADIEAKINNRFEVMCFKTSIWDETLYRAWS